MCMHIYACILFFVFVSFCGSCMFPRSDANAQLTEPHSLACVRGIVAMLLLRLRLIAVFFLFSVIYNALSCREKRVTLLSPTSPTHVSSDYPLPLSARSAPFPYSFLFCPFLSSFSFICSFYSFRVCACVFLFVFSAVVVLTSLLLSTLWHSSTEGFVARKKSVPFCLSFPTSPRLFPRAGKSVMCRYARLISGS